MTDDSLQTLQRLILETPAESFENTLNDWRAEAREQYPGACAERQEELAQMLAASAVDVRSALTEWRLRCSRFCSCEPCREVSQEAFAAASAETLAVLREWGREDLASQAETEIADIGASNLWKLTRMSLEGKANTWWGNDYATGLWGGDAARRGHGHHQPGPGEPGT